MRPTMHIERSVSIAGSVLAAKTHFSSRVAVLVSMTRALFVFFFVYSLRFSIWLTVQQGRRAASTTLSVVYGIIERVILSCLTFPLRFDAESFRIKL